MKPGYQRRQVSEADFDSGGTNMRWESDGEYRSRCRRQRDADRRRVQRIIRSYLPEFREVALQRAIAIAQERSIATGDASVKMELRYDVRVALRSSSVTERWFLPNVIFLNHEAVGAEPFTVFAAIPKMVTKKSGGDPKFVVEHRLPDDLTED